MYNKLACSAGYFRFNFAFMLISSTLLTLLLSEVTGVDPTPLLLLLLDALVVIPFLWVKGGELWHADDTKHENVGKLLRFFAVLNAAFILRFVIGIIGLR